jgi:hypothetical protein
MAVRSLVPECPVAACSDSKSAIASVQLLTLRLDATTTDPCPLLYCHAMDLDRGISLGMNGASNPADTSAVPLSSNFPFFGGMPAATMFGAAPNPYATMASQTLLPNQLANPANWQQLAANTSMMPGWSPQVMAVAFNMASQMSAPVGGERDEEILVRVLHGSYRNGKSFKQAIETELHGVRRAYMPPK